MVTITCPEGSHDAKSIYNLLKSCKVNETFKWSCSVARNAFCEISISGPPGFKVSTAELDSVIDMLKVARQTFAREEQIRNEVDAALDVHGAGGV